MKPLGYGVLFGVLIATVVASLVFALTDRGTKAAPKLPAPARSIDPTPRKADFAGTVHGNGGLIALSVRNGKAVGYFCDGRREAWLTQARARARARPATGRGWGRAPWAAMPRLSMAQRSGALIPGGFTSGLAY